ncbi:MAG: CAP domain-containing protein [Planctomycetota bacterium]
MRCTGMASRFGLAAASLLLAVGVARADVIYLSSGGIVKGTVVKETGDTITVKTAGGSTTVIPRAEIERIESGGSPEQMYRERLKKIPLGDAEGHYQLALWLKKINCKDLVKEELQKTIMLDPEHKFARDELGYVRDKAGRWILPQEKLEDEPAGSTAPASTAPEPKAEPTPEPKAVEVKLDQNGFSPELSMTMASLAAKDAAARDAGFAKLDAAVESESARLVELLAAPFSKGREKVAQAIAKAVPGADAVFAKVPTDGTKDEGLKSELKAQVDSYVEKNVKPSVLASVHQIERVSVIEAGRAAGFLKTFIKDYHTDSAQKRREKAWKDWDSAREIAIKTIFDLKIYPDENHGRVGQKIVDEKVDAVRAAWQFLDPQVQRDLARFLGTNEADAKRSIQHLDDARARQKAALAWLTAKGEKVEPATEASAIEECLLRYRAGQVDEAVAMTMKLNSYEKELLKRIRDQRVLDYNENFKNAPKIDKGKLPSGQEIQQVAITNEYRIMQGRPAVEIDCRLIESARGHSEEMTRLGYFDHTSPVGANKSPWDRMKNAGYPGAGGENISLGSEAPKATHIAWYNSSGHHRNILGERWIAMGSGKDGRHWTQNFGGSEGLLKR